MHTYAHTCAYLLLGKRGVPVVTYKKSQQWAVTIQKLSQRGIVAEQQHITALYLKFQGLGFALARF